MWLGKSDFTDEHLVRTDGEGVVYARSVRRIAEHSWSEENLREVVEAPQKPKSTTLDSPPAADPLAPPPAVPEVHEDEKEEPTEKPAEDAGVQGVPPDTAMTPGASSSSRGEKRTETQEATSVKKTVNDEVINREANSHVCRRACQTKTDGEKTDTKNDDVLMPVESVDSYLFNTVNTLLSDEAGVETNLWNDDSKK